MRGGAGAGGHGVPPARDGDRMTCNVDAVGAGVWGPRGTVPVLQPLQALQQNLYHFTVAQVRDDATHVCGGAGRKSVNG